jgi:hypothetical protein
MRRKQLDRELVQLDRAVCLAELGADPGEYAVPAAGLERIAARQQAVANRMLG